MPRYDNERAIMTITFTNQFWTVTSGDLTDRRRPLQAPPKGEKPKDAKPIVIDPCQRHQPWIGAGAAITDAAA